MHSRRHTPAQRHIVERQHSIADNLALLMPLAREQDDVIRPRPLDRRRDRSAPSADLLAPGAPAITAARIAEGSSDRGLSSVTIT
jgi:hypothetical protein